jgi:Zn-dependent protease
VWKLKAIAFVVLSQGKLLLFGLTKSSTLVSMLASLGVYWAAFGWRFAAGLIGSIYVHEMGHVAALRRLGIPASPPMFIPGFGAVIRAGLGRATPREDARVGLAGPIWGFGAAVAAYVIFLAGGGPIWAAIARVGALINLFNLLPVWQLDGARAFHPMNRLERSIAAAAIVTMFLVTREHLLVLLAVMAAVQIVRADGQTTGDRLSLIQYSGLVIILSLMTTITVTVGS